MKYHWEANKIPINKLLTPIVSSHGSLQSVLFIILYVKVQISSQLNCVFKTVKRLFVWLYRHVFIIHQFEYIPQFKVVLSIYFFKGYTCKLVLNNAYSLLMELEYFWHL